MKYLIRYHKTNGSNTYLNIDNMFSKKSNGKIQYFPNLKKAQNHLLIHMNADTRKKLLQNRSKDGFEIITDDGMLVEKPFVHADKAKNTSNKQETSLDTTFNELRKHLNHILILDLEFYQEANQNLPRMAQIAGTILGESSKSSAFNGYIFDSVHMNETQQLNFLKKHDFTYKQALKCNAKAIMKQVKLFIASKKSILLSVGVTA